MDCIAFSKRQNNNAARGALLYLYSGLRGTACIFAHVQAVWMPNGLSAIIVNELVFCTLLDVGMRRYATEIACQLLCFDPPCLIVTRKNP